MDYRDNFDYVITVQKYDKNSKENDRPAGSVTFSDNQIGKELYTKGMKDFCLYVMPCENCKYEGRSALQRPCFDCRRIKPDLYENIYRGDDE